MLIGVLVLVILSTLVEGAGAGAGSADLTVLSPSGAGVALSITPGEYRYYSIEDVGPSTDVHITWPPSSRCYVHISSVRDPRAAGWVLSPGSHLGMSGCSRAAPCSVGQGDCNSDSDCAGTLRCYMRSTSDGDSNFPPCILPGNLIVDSDVCYDPTLTASTCPQWEPLTSSEKTVHGSSTGFISIAIYAPGHNDFAMFEGQQYAPMDDVERSLPLPEKEAIPAGGNGWLQIGSWRIGAPLLRSCPDACSSHGTCNEATGVCACASGYIGSNCATVLAVAAPGTTLLVPSVTPTSFTVARLTYIYYSLPNIPAYASVVITVKPTSGDPDV
jgi:hypothetical protein